MFERRRILIAEDEALIAFELAQAIEEAGGEVVGPVASVQEAVRLLEREDVDAAILDVRLADGHVGPVAMLLLRRGRTVLFHSASPVPAEIVARFGAQTICPKPMPSARVVADLEALMARDR